jgi:hypothetical protein
MLYASRNFKLRSDHRQTGANPVQTYSVNSLAEQFEIDRGTMVRALKNVLPDAEVTGGRPTYKIATASRALEAHHRSTSSPRTKAPTHNAIDPRLQQLYGAIDQADASMRKLKTLPDRRAAAVARLRPILDETQRMQILVGQETGQEPAFTGLLSDKLYMLALRGLEAPCQWNQDETWAAMSVEE